MPYFPPWSGSLTHWVTLTFALSFPLFFVTEATGKGAFGYSKFADRTKSAALPSRLGMFIIYFPAVLIYPAIHFLGGAPASTWRSVTMVLLSVHFGKRTLETLFVHKYSGVMNAATAVLICSLYSTVSALHGWVATHELSVELVTSDGFGPPMVVRLLIWAAGTAINGYHHVLLAGLRKPGETGYKVAHGRSLFMSRLPPLSGRDHGLGWQCADLQSYHRLRRHHHHDCLFDGLFTQHGEMVPRQRRGRRARELETAVPVRVLGF